jgi:hypothetical protein
MILKNKKKIIWLVWLFFVVIWNYGYPDATPLQDVLIAVLLSIIFYIWNKKK